MADRPQETTDFERGWREGIQTACVMLISLRAQAEEEARQSRAMGYRAIADALDAKARMASEIEGALRRRQEKGR